MVATCDQLDSSVGMMTVLIIGCAVCTALSTSGAFISDLKVGYWLGATPRRQQRWKFLGIVVAALCVGFVIDVLSQGYGFVVTPETPNALPAPQGNLMASIVSAIFGGVTSTTQRTLSSAATVAIVFTPITASRRWLKRNPSPASTSDACDTSSAFAVASFFSCAALVSVFACSHSARIRFTVVKLSLQPNLRSSPTMR